MNNTTNPTLIAGFEDVMNYIKNQDQMIKKLKEENKKLKNDIRLCAEGLIPSDLIQRGIVETCREKVKKLEEENKELKEEINHKNEKFGEWCEENKELKEENSILRDLIQNKLPVGCIAETTYQPILDENEKLKEEINGDGLLKQGYKTDLSNSHKQQNSMIKQIMELKEELEDLRDYKSRYEAQVQENEETLASLNFYQEANKELKEEIKKLNEEIKELRVTWREESTERIATSRENRELKEKNVEYTEMFHEIRDYMLLGESYEVETFHTITDNKFKE